MVVVTARRLKPVACRPKMAAVVVVDRAIILLQLSLVVPVETAEWAVPVVVAAGPWRVLRPDKRVLAVGGDGVLLVVVQQHQQ
jgi:hypothetical protein